MIKKQKNVLVLLILVSQRAELVAVEVMVSIFGSDEQKRRFEEQQMIQRGKGPMILECVVGFYVLGKKVYLFV